MQVAEQRRRARVRGAPTRSSSGRAQLTAITNNWTPYYVQRVRAVLDNKWTSGDVWGGLDNKMVVMAPYTSMPDDVEKSGDGDRGGHHQRQAAPVQMPRDRAGRHHGGVQGGATSTTGGFSA